MVSVMHNRSVYAMAPQRIMDSPSKRSAIATESRSDKTNKANKRTTCSTRAGSSASSAQTRESNKQRNPRLLDMAWIANGNETFDLQDEIESEADMIIKDMECKSHTLILEHNKRWNAKLLACVDRGESQVIGILGCRIKRWVCGIQIVLAEIRDGVQGNRDRVVLVVE